MTTSLDAKTDPPTNHRSEDVPADEITAHDDDGALALPQELDEPNNNDNSSSAIETSLSSLYSKLTWLEISGACGDFGTLFPLLVALARQRKIHLAPTFALTGICHIITGWYWDIPMPLQPMHMISAQALADSLEGPTQVATAGVGMGIAFILVNVVGGIEWLHKCIPKSVIGGLQLGVGWNVVIKGLNMIRALPWWGQLDCIVTAILLSAMVLYDLRPSASSSSTTTSSRGSIWQRLRQEPPVGLYLFGMGMCLAILQLFVWNDDDDKDKNTDLHLQSEPLLRNALRHATWKDWSIGLMSGTLPQLPLTALNSCLSVCLLAETLFPSQQQGQQEQGGRRVVSRKSVCWSLGLMNVIGCPLGMMPHCHGAGGLAGQVRLGASSGVSMMGLGIFKLLLSAWAAQGSLLGVLDALPVSVLGVLLALSGHELAATGIKAILANHPHAGSSSETNEPIATTRRNQDISIALVTGVVIVGTGKAHVGVLCGWLTYLLHGNGMQELFGDWWRRNRRRWNSNNNEGGDEERGAYSHLATSDD